MSVHFIRPFWLLTFIPLIYWIIQFYRQSPHIKAWTSLCDPHLMSHLIITTPPARSTLQSPLIKQIAIAVCMILALSGPSFKKLSIPHYEPMQPRVILLDVSTHALKTNLKPDRLSRAKFKIHDLLHQQKTGLIGLILYTGEPFIASPLTHDVKTIDMLLNDISPHIMPVDGLRLDLALQEADQLIRRSGALYGDILVLTGEPPTPEDIKTAKSLAKKGYHSSILPLTSSKRSITPFQTFTEAGNGVHLYFTETSEDMTQWLTATQKKDTFQVNTTNNLPHWRDDGRFFLMPAGGILLTFFRRKEQPGKKP